jgi:hypothetical protein
MIYGIISRSDMYDFFYTNDLYVLVDIILRRLEGLDDDKECSRVGNMDSRNKEESKRDLMFKKCSYAMVIFGYYILY